MTPEEIRLECLKLTVGPIGSLTLTDAAALIVAAARFADFVANGAAAARVSAEPAVTDRHGQHWTPEADDALRQMTADGLTARRIGNHLKRTAAAVLRRRVMLGITNPTPAHQHSTAAMRAARAVLAAKRAAA